MLVSKCFLTDGFCLSIQVKVISTCDLDIIVEAKIPFSFGMVLCDKQMKKRKTSKSIFLMFLLKVLLFYAAVLSVRWPWKYKTSFSVYRILFLRKAFPLTSFWTAVLGPLLFDVTLKVGISIQEEEFWLLFQKFFLYMKCTWTS